MDIGGWLVGLGFNVLYMSVCSLCSVLEGFRLFLVIDFIEDTAKDLLYEYKDRMTEREIHVCRLLSKESTTGTLKRHTVDVEVLRRHTAMVLYELFKICRKLPIEDKEVVVANFNQLEIEV
jgi:hypothetical protein